MGHWEASRSGLFSLCFGMKSKKGEAMGQGLLGASLPHGRTVYAVAHGLPWRVEHMLYMRSSPYTLAGGEDLMSVIALSMGL